jgi:hypothetical protein
LKQVPRGPAGISWKLNCPCSKRIVIHKWESSGVSLRALTKIHKLVGERA